MSCDLCGSEAFETVVVLDRQTSMRSDRVVVRRRLAKVACSRCGLVRSAERLADETLDAEYAADYGTATEEHRFYTSNGPVRRSVAFADWMSPRVPDLVWTSAKTAFEVGAGSGLLVQELQRRHSSKHIIGIEPNLNAAARGRARGVDIRASLDDAPTSVDLAWSIAVLEHVQSPTAFLDAIRTRLDIGAYLVLAQPTADVASYDVLFVDHLHHFSSPHLTVYAGKCGFQEVFAAVGHPLMPNFSLHVWQAVDAAKSIDVPSCVPSRCRDAAVEAIEAMARFDQLLDRLRRANRRVAVFGVHEVYGLARAYSALDAFPVVCGLDDDPARPERDRLSFPLVRPEDAPGLGVTDVLLTMNANYYGLASDRCEALGLTPHPLFGGVQ
jgi:SAM-dependent methyltransferase